jgi:hypothetical protein
VKIPDASAAELPGIVGPNAIESAAVAPDWGQSAKTPFGFAASDVNQYRYVGNRPTNATDPSGLEELGWGELFYPGMIGLNPEYHRGVRLDRQLNELKRRRMQEKDAFEQAQALTKIQQENLKRAAKDASGLARACVEVEAAGFGGAFLTRGAATAAARGSTTVIDDAVEQADDVPRWKRWWRSRYGAKRVPQKAADPAAAVNALSKYRSRRFFINGQNLLLDKSGMKHILERHHPSYWNGTVKSSQSFFPKNMSITDIEESIAEVLKQNPDKICEIGANGIGSMTGVVNGEI